MHDKAYFPCNNLLSAVLVFQYCIFATSQILQNSSRLNTYYILKYKRTLRNQRDSQGHFALSILRGGCFLF
jgi:hypothetical protein